MKNYVLAAIPIIVVARTAYTIIRDYRREVKRFNWPDFERMSESERRIEAVETLFNVDALDVDYDIVPSLGQRLARNRFAKSCGVK